MEEKKVKKIVGINTIKKRLKNALEKQGSYDESIDVLIEITAESLQAFYEITSERRQNPEPTLTEKTRENNIKVVANPLYKMQIEYLEMIRKQLRELRLTLATAEGMADDEIEAFMDEVENVK